MGTSLKLEQPISKLPSIGPRSAQAFAKLSIFTIGDLIYYFPFRYEDLSNTKSISELQLGEVATFKASVWQITKFRTRTGKTIIKATLNDGNASIDAIWFNQDYLLTVLKPNLEINFSGKIGIFSKKKTIINPKYEILKTDQPIHTSRLVPIYSETAGLSSKFIRAKIHSLLQNSEINIEEILPQALLTKEVFPNRKLALQWIHFPENLDQIKQSRERLMFEELLLLHLRNSIYKDKKNLEENAFRLNLSQAKLHNFELSLPFKLTTSQKRAKEEILADLTKETPMNRLLQGEVGSGKTIVSSFAILATALNNLQTAFMAPTEILAKQHFETLTRIFGKKLNISLVTSSSKYKGEDFDLVVGTHALLNKDLKFRKLGLVIVDEQQRFGVTQRSLLRSKGSGAHFLTMTATPIPRTLALTVYGQLEMSIINQLPTERKPIKTYLVPRTKRDSAYDFVKKEVKAGGQVFILCPLIDSSETLTSVKAATTELVNLKEGVFKEFSLGLLHGKLSSGEKSKVMEDFRNKKIDILVTTPVVEVGIDIPNASLILIEASERFGLSSLHQLRGRVGRGKRQSYCLLFTEKEDPRTYTRLKLLEKSNNGLELAELDLKLRGAGDIFGTLQHGQIELKIADQANLELIVKTKQEADQLLKSKLPENLEKLVKTQITPVVRSDTKD